MNVIEKFILKKSLNILKKYNLTTVKTENNIFQLMSFEFHEWCYDLTKGYKLFREQNNLQRTTAVDAEITS